MEQHEDVKNKPYHHGNLRQTLIETGIQFVSQNGDQALSLRKLSTLCGVTHTAIYSYFKDKDALFQEMRDYVSEQFAKSMEDEIEHTDHSIPQEVAYALATGYVRFFIENPRYYYFVISREDLNINLDDLEEVNIYRPFEVFKQYAVPYLQYRHIPASDQKRVLINMWAIVHGIAGIAILPGTKFSGDWIQITREILQNNFDIEGRADMFVHR